MSFRKYSDEQLSEALNSDISDDLRVALEKELQQRAAPETVDATNIYPTGTTYGRRMALAASTSPEQSLEFLKREYDDARMLPDGSLIYKENGGWHAANPEGFDMGDTAQFLRMLPEMAGGGLGLAAGSAGGPVGALALGAGSATAAGEGYDTMVRGFHGMDDDRSFMESALDNATNMGLEMVGGAIANRFAPSPVDNLIPGQPNTGANMEAINAFERSGVEPTTGMTVPGLAPLEAGLAANPLLRSGVPAVDEQIADSLMRRTGDVTSMTTPQDVGSFLSDRVNRYLQTFTEQADANYQEVGRYLEPDSSFPLNSFKRRVNELVNRFENDPEWGEELIPKEIMRWQELLDEKGTVSYNTINALRQEIGSSLTNPSSTLLRNLDDATKDSLYGALNNDLKAGAEFWDPRAKDALDNALDYYSEGKKFIDEDLKQIVGRRDPEEMIEYVLAKARKGDTKANVLGRLLTDDELNEVGSAIQRMRMRANPGSPNEYAPGTFLTRMKELSPEATDAIFPQGSGSRDILDDTVAMATASKQRGSLDNTSGTARGVLSNLTTGGAGYALTSAAVGDFSGAAQVIGSIAGPVVTDALLQNPAVRKKLQQWAVGRSFRTDKNRSALIGMMTAAGMSKSDAEEVMVSLMPEEQPQQPDQFMGQGELPALMQEMPQAGDPTSSLMGGLHAPPQMGPQMGPQMRGPQMRGPQTGPQMPPLLNRAQLGPPPTDIMGFTQWASMQDYIDTVRSDGAPEEYRRGVLERQTGRQIKREQEDMMKMLEGLG